MKQFIVFLLIVLLSIPVYASEPIYLSFYKVDKGENTRDDRSLSVAPIASHDGNVITIYSEKVLENAGDELQ